MATEQKNFHANFNILSCFIIWHKNFSPMWTWLREKKIKGLLPMVVLCGNDEFSILMLSTKNFTSVFKKGFLFPENLFQSIENV